MPFTFKAFILIRASFIGQKNIECTCRTVAMAVLSTLSEFLESARSRKQTPNTAATPSCQVEVDVSYELSKLIATKQLWWHGFGTEKV